MTQQCEGAAFVTCLNHGPWTAYSPQQWAPPAVGADVLAEVQFVCSSFLCRRLHDNVRWADSHRLWAAFALPTCIMWFGLHGTAGSPLQVALQGLNVQRWYCHLYTTLLPSLIKPHLLCLQGPCLHPSTCTLWWGQPPQA